jgi:multidrug resistance efflux pump
LPRLLSHWPLFSWLGLTVLCVGLFVRTTQYGIVTATAQVIQHDLAPLQMARVKEIYVQIGNHVTNGQPVAQLDTALIDTQLAEAEATLVTVQTTMAGYQGQMMGLVRTADDEILKSKRVLELEKNQRDSAVAKLAQLVAIQAERDKLSKSNLIPEQLADALRPEIAGLDKEVAAYPSQMTMDQRALEDQQKHRAELQKTLHLGPEEDVTKAIAEKALAESKVLETVVEMRKRERETYSLRAETDGVVSDIHILAGVVAKAGESVATIVSKSDLIIGYLPEIRLGRLNPGDHGYAFRIGRPAVKVQVVSVVPELNPMPVQIRPISLPIGATMRSQKVVFRAEEPSDITPGEKVEIRMETNWWAKTKRCLATLSL